MQRVLVGVDTSTQVWESYCRNLCCRSNDTRLWEALKERRLRICLSSMQGTRFLTGIYTHAGPRSLSWESCIVWLEGREAAVFLVYDTRYLEDVFERLDRRLWRYLIAGA